MLPLPQPPWSGLALSARPVYHTRIPVSGRFPLFFTVLPTPPNRQRPISAICNAALSAISLSVTAQPALRRRHDHSERDGESRSLASPDLARLPAWSSLLGASAKVRYGSAASPRIDRRPSTEFGTAFSNPPEYQSTRDRHSRSYVSLTNLSLPVPRRTRSPLLLGGISLFIPRGLREARGVFGCLSKQILH